MKVVAVIPARYASTRFPGKPLEKILGRPMLSWVINGVKACSLVDEVLVATDDERIASLAQENQVRVKMTSSEISSGSDRVWAAIKDEKWDLVVNVQGDEPLVTPTHVEKLLAPFYDDDHLQMATLSHPFDSLEEWQSPNAVKVISNSSSNAIYFSRFPIPHSKVDAVQSGQLKPLAQKHIGLYAFRASFLKTFCETPPTELEMGESLEQLRALYLGAKIQVIPVEQKLQGVDTPEDLYKIEKILKETHGE